jgi:nicotinamidase-related amidase
VAQGYTSALVVVDMQNDFLAEGGYYGEITRLKDARAGKLSQADIDALTELYLRPPSECVIRDGYQELVTRVAGVAAMALARKMRTIFRADDLRSSVLLQTTIVHSGARAQRLCMSPWDLGLGVGRAHQGAGHG